MARSEEEKAARQYFMDHPEFYKLVEDNNFIYFIYELSKGAQSRADIDAHFRKLDVESLLKKGMETGAVKTIVIAGVEKYYVSDEGRTFLHQLNKIIKDFKALEEE